VVTTLWHWWLERNRIRGGEKRREVGGLAFEIRFHTEEYLKLAASENPKPPKTLRRWTKPGGEVLKINSDGSFHEKEKIGAWSFVVRDSDGHGVLAGSGKLAAVHDALFVESEAVLAALKAAIDVGISLVIVEADSTNLLSAIQTASFDQAPGGVIFREIRDLISLHFIDIKFSYVPRCCNRSAHKLAQSGFVWDPSHPIIWLDPLLNFVKTLLDRDIDGSEFPE